jgi:DNA-binding NarL/FixJ family response regulator
MQNVNGKTAGGEGLLLLDDKFNPILLNPLAAEILAYPQKLDGHNNLKSFLATKVRAVLLSEVSSNGPTIVSQFRSGRRKYCCRTFPITSLNNGDSETALALLLERPAVTQTTHLFEKFNLTMREQEVAHFLLQGLTSKEIGSRMQISPNTVKAFLRLIMVKMGVSTRSGILGKAFTADAL